MAGHSTTSTDHLIRSQLWSTEIKEVFEDELMGIKYVNFLEGFGDGDTFNIPSIGQHEVLDYEEGEAVRYTKLDTGNFTFTITEYKQAATYITNKMKQDTFYLSQLESAFVPKQNRAIMKAMEVDVLNLGPEGQTASNINLINGARHRWVAGGTNQIVELADFARARYALEKANVPMTNLVAIVDPSVAFHLQTLTNTTNLLSPMPMWEGVIKTGITTGTRFVFNLYGFDVHVSQNLKRGGSETIDSVTSSVGIGNIFFSATPDALPFVGAVRQPPKVDSSYNKDLQRDEYVTTARWGLKLYRPENMVVVLSDDDQVYV